MHGKAREQSEIDGERETIEISVTQAMGKNKYGNIIQSELKDKLYNNVGEEKTEVIDNGETIVVKFNESNRYYEVDGNGNISEPITMTKDEYAGDLTKGGRCDGTEENPYEISCIEDLVAFSIMTNGGNSELGLSSNNFNNKHVILTRTLDFKSIFSYNDYTSTIYGDLNTDRIVENIRKELTKTDEGCIGFTGIKNFIGTFDGKENSIENIYENSTSNTALFISDSGKDPNEIKNLSLTGVIIGKSWAAGICSKGAKNINNCKNYVNVTGYNMAGGIADLVDGYTNIVDCENYGTIKITGAAYAYSGAGGIVGCLRKYDESNPIIKNCVNYGNVNGNSSCSGILGSIAGGHECKIINCINKGESQSGILQLLFYGKANILNCCNLGKTTNAGIVNNIRYNEIVINNCYNAGTSDIAIIGKKDATGTINVINTYYDQTRVTSVGIETEGIEALNEEDIKNNLSFVEILNNNIGENTDWKRWKIGEDGYPTFE